ncbi:MAG: long-chain-fatty-acid--CoA ligase [Burkholderiaceae bacterium]
MAAGPTPPHLRFWPRGVPHGLRTPEVTLNHYLEVTAQRYPGKPAIVFCGQTLAYAQLQRQVHALAGHLQQVLGVSRGDRVLLMGQNSPQYVVAYYAVLQAGAAVVPINPMSTAHELAFYVQDSGARVALVAADLLERVLPLLRPGLDDALHHLVLYSYADGLPGALDGSLPAAMQVRVPFVLPEGVSCLADALSVSAQPGPGMAGPDDLAVLPYTSGTTGHPKGCRHTHRTVLASNLASQVWRGLHGDAVFLCVAPLFHMLGMQNGMNMPMTLGATVVMMPRWNAAQAVELVERHRVTVWTAPPAMVIDFFAQPEAATRDLSSLALLSGGGAAMPEAVATLLAERFGLYYNEAYGLSETAAFLHANPVARGKRQCLGMPTQGVESRIVDPVTLQPLPPGEVGELVTRGEQVMLGYWRNPEADAAAFVEIGGQRYFRTGDLASVDEEGYFFMRDRLKRMINASGFKVWPAEVESMLYEHPAVHEACIVGIPDARRGEDVRALVVLKPGQQGQVSEQDIIDWSRQRMAVYKAPRSVRFMDHLPKSGTGKILWRELQESECRQVNTEEQA